MPLLAKRLARSPILVAVKPGQTALFEIEAGFLTTRHGEERTRGDRLNLLSDQR